MMFLTQSEEYEFKSNDPIRCVIIDYDTLLISKRQFYLINEAFATRNLQLLIKDELLRLSKGNLTDRDACEIVGERLSVILTNYIEMHINNIKRVTESYNGIGFMLNVYVRKRIITCKS